MAQQLRCRQTTQHLGKNVSKQPNEITQQAEPSIWVKKISQNFQ